MDQLQGACHSGISLNGSWLKNGERVNTCKIAPGMYQYTAVDV